MPISFLLKTQEKLIDLDYYYYLPLKLLHFSHHAFQEGKSTDSALHNLVKKIELNLYYKQHTAYICFIGHRMRLRKYVNSICGRRAVKRHARLLSQRINSGWRRRSCSVGNQRMSRRRSPFFTIMIPGRR